MVQRREIKKWCDKVVREFRPQKIILFGSYARGNATEDSDIDVLIIMELGRRRRNVLQAAAIRERVPAGFPMDLLVRSPRQIARRLARADGFIRDVIQHGRLLYEGEHA